MFVVPLISKSSFVCIPAWLCQREKERKKEVLERLERPSNTCLGAS